MKDLLYKIRSLSENKRKIIFWVVMIIFSLTLLSFYVKYIQKKVAGISVEKTKKELQTDPLEEILNKLREIKIPKIEIPKIDKETLKELEKTIEEISTKEKCHEPIE